MFEAPKLGRFRSLASHILVVNVVGKLQRKRTLAASRGFLAAARLSCYINYNNRCSKGSQRILLRQDRRICLRKLVTFVPASMSWHVSCPLPLLLSLLLRWFSASYDGPSVELCYDSSVSCICVSSSCLFHCCCVPPTVSLSCLIWLTPLWSSVPSV